MTEERDIQTYSDNTSWTNVAYMTPVMVRDMDGQSWERAYFVTKDNADKKAPFAVIRVERLNYIKNCWETGNQSDRPVLEWFKRCMLATEEHMIINFDVPLNANHQNALIRANVLIDEEMRELGFTDCVEDTWYLCRRVSDDITFNVSINKKTAEVEIEVLEEDFLQHFDYQEQIRRGRNDKYIVAIHDKVQNHMAWLMRNRIIEGYRLGDYI